MTKVVFNSKGFEILFGVELEFFTVDKHFEPIDIHRLLRKSKLYGSCIHPEFCREQVELMVEPSSNIFELEQKIHEVLSEVHSICDSIGVFLLPASVSSFPLTLSSGLRYKKIFNKLGKNFFRGSWTCGDQINIGVKDEFEAIKVYNKMRAFLPIITGLSVSSPLTKGVYTGETKMNRLKMFDFLMTNYPDAIRYPLKFDSLSDFAKAKGSFDFYRDIGTYYSYVRMKPKMGVGAEIRSLDKQPSVREYLSFVALCKGLLLVDSFSEDNLETDFVRARKEGIFDKKLFLKTLDLSKKNLPLEERHYLDPLYSRIENGTVADVMIKKISNGASMEDIYRDLVRCLREDICFK